MMTTGCEYDNNLHVDDGMDLDCKMGEMDVDKTHQQRAIFGNSKLVRKIGEIVRDLRNLGFTSMAEDAYASAIFLLLKVEYLTVNLQYQLPDVLPFSDFVTSNLLLFTNTSYEFGL